MSDSAGDPDSTVVAADDGAGVGSTGRSCRRDRPVGNRGRPRSGSGRSRTVGIIIGG